jgi:hypothetical protein
VGRQRRAEIGPRDRHEGDRAIGKDELDALVLAVQASRGIDAKLLAAERMPDADDGDLIWDGEFICLMS